MTEQEAEMLNCAIDVATNQVRAELGADLRKLAAVWISELRGLRNELRQLARLPPLPAIETDGDGDDDGCRH